MSLPKAPKIQAPAAAPAAPDLTPARQKLGSANPTTVSQVTKKKGRSALRIDLQTGGNGLYAGRAGANVPLA